MPTQMQCLSHSRLSKTGYIDLSVFHTDDYQTIEKFTYFEKINGKVIIHVTNVISLSRTAIFKNIKFESL